ncbi:hypothetical protein BH20VER1_BH20VER1_28730 [soil metagenome]
MPALRQPVRRRRSWIIWTAAAALAAAAVADWLRPPREQFSVRAYEWAVIAPYQCLVRPLTSSVIRCSFRPTCSRYSMEAVRAYGFPRGAWMTTKRLFRCMPWVKPGARDPVPPPP